MAVKAKSEVISINILKPDIQVLQLSLVGDSRFVSNRWSSKARKMMLDKQMGKAVAKKEKKSPEADFKESLYVHQEGWYGFPAHAFKGAVVAAAMRYVERVA